MGVIEIANHLVTLNVCLVQGPVGCLSLELVEAGFHVPDGELAGHVLAAGHAVYHAATDVFLLLITAVPHLLDGGEGLDLVDELLEGLDLAVHLPQPVLGRDDLCPDLDQLLLIGLGSLAARQVPLTDPLRQRLILGKFFVIEGKVFG